LAVAALVSDFKQRAFGASESMKPRERQPDERRIVSTGNRVLGVRDGGTTKNDRADDERKAAPLSSFADRREPRARILERGHG
jgi:hypothetical protein